MSDNKKFCKINYSSIFSKQKSIYFWTSVFPTVIIGGITLGLIFYVLMFFGKDHKRCSKRDCIILRECNEYSDYQWNVELQCQDGWNKTIQVSSNNYKNESKPDALARREIRKIEIEKTNNGTNHIVFCGHSCQFCFYNECYFCKSHLKLVIINTGKMISTNESLHGCDSWKQMGFLKEGFLE